MSRHPDENLNLVQIFLDRVRSFEESDALYYKRGNFYHSLSWKRWAGFSRRIALALRYSGVGHGDRVGILSENRPEWAFADFGILSLGAISVPLYATSSLQEIEYILEHAGIQVLFLSAEHQLKKIQELPAAYKNFKKVILFDESPPIEDSQVCTLSQFCDQGRLHAFNNETLYRKLVDAVSPDDIATLIYTSGTTGPPKGAMLTHRNFVANYIACSERIHVSPRDLSFSFLPLSHVFERLAGYYYIIFNGGRIAYAESMQTVQRDLMEAKPTIAASVPRLYEKIHARILETIEAASPLQKKIFYWARAIGQRASQKRLKKIELGWKLAAANVLAKIFVFKKLKKGLGGRIRFFISGGAPLQKDLAEFFYAADVLILEGYGLTETSPVIAVNAVEKFKFGTVGRPFLTLTSKLHPTGKS